jgi:hypothetical protein
MQETAGARRAAFVRWMQGRFLLRVHMAVILGLTFLAGLAVTKVFLEAGSTSLALRYGTAVAVCYVAFLALMKLWLWYVSDEPTSLDAGDAVDVVDTVADMAGGALRDTARAGFRGGGGRFGGGGASHSFADTQGSGSGAGLLDGVGGGDDDLVVVLVVAVVVAAVAACGLYLVYVGPTILAEAAFEALLASSLLRGARKAESPGWVGGVVKATALPFLLIFALGVGFGAWAQRACPGARRAVDVLECDRRG